MWACTERIPCHSIRLNICMKSFSLSGRTAAAAVVFRHGNRNTFRIKQQKNNIFDTIWKEFEHIFIPCPVSCKSVHVFRMWLVSDFVNIYRCTFFRCTLILWLMRTPIYMPTQAHTHCVWTVKHCECEMRMRVTCKIRKLKIIIPRIKKNLVKLKLVGTKHHNSQSNRIEWISVVVVSSWIVLFVNKIHKQKYRSWYTHAHIKGRYWIS